MADTFADSLAGLAPEDQKRSSRRRSSVFSSINSEVDHGRRQIMRAFGNVLWHFPFFGFVDAFFAYSLGFLLTLTVVGAPIGLGLMEYGKFLLSPFGKEMIRKTELNISQTPAGKAFSTFITIIYLPFGIVICAAACIQIFFYSSLSLAFLLG